VKADERKRGLRAAVDAKLRGIAERKREPLERILPTLGDSTLKPMFIRLFALGWEVNLLWEIIDSLVDEVESVRPADEEVKL